MTLIWAWKFLRASVACLKGKNQSFETEVRIVAVW
jgi:hypothetical protein